MSASIFTALVSFVTLCHSQIIFPDGQLVGTSFGVPGVNVTYDYVIVGGGTAGLTIATRLAEGNATVAVIEAGSFYQLTNGNLSQVPGDLLASSNASTLNGVNGLIDWRFQTTAQTQLQNRTLHFTRGKCLGGSSARNYMVYNRATIDALEMWATDVGDDSYQWANMLPYYEKSVKYTAPNEQLRLSNTTTPSEASAFRHADGPLHVSYPNFVSALGSYYPAAFSELGVSQVQNGINAGSLLGWTYPTFTIDPAHETRSSSETSFLQYAFHHGLPLTIYTQAMASKIIFDNTTTARQVLVNSGGLNFALSARKEIIVSGGVAQSPQLLMVSGIGPKETLNRYNISVIADRPGVGQNMWDNPLISLTYSTSLTVPSGAEAVAQYLQNETGPLTSPGTDVVAFLKLTSRSFLNLNASTISAFQTAFPADWPEAEYLGGSNPGIRIALLASFSRGNISINSTSMADPPVISPNWLLDPRDRALAIAAFKYGRFITNTTSIRSVTGSLGETVPGPAVQSDEQILGYILGSVTSIFHGSCTCKMGMRNDSMAVVDSEARVIGVNGLRVVDVSAFPFLVPGQPQSMVYALAEKIADVILDSQ